MNEMKITFKNPDEILEFVKTVSKYEFDMDIRKGRVVVDAKSLLGVMHLGLNFLERIKYAAVREVIVNHLAHHHNHYAYHSGGLHKPDIVFCMFTDSLATALF